MNVEKVNITEELRMLRHNSALLEQKKIEEQKVKAEMEFICPYCGRKCYYPNVLMFEKLHVERVVRVRST